MASSDRMGRRYISDRIRMPRNIRIGVHRRLHSAVLCALCSSASLRENLICVFCLPWVRPGVAINIGVHQFLTKPHNNKETENED